MMGPAVRQKGPVGELAIAFNSAVWLRRASTYFYSDELQHQVYLVQAVEDQLESVRLSKLSTLNVHDCETTPTIRSYSNLNESTSKVKDTEKGKHIQRSVVARVR